MAEITGGPHRGHAAGSNDIEKAASQLVSDIKYKVRLEMDKMGGRSHLNPAQVAQKYTEKLNSSPAPGPVKALAKKKLSTNKLKEEYNIDKLAQESLINVLNKVFVEGIEEPVASLQSEELEEKKYKIRVTDKNTGNTYVRMATRAKIAELRANPNISSVEMTSYGEPSESEKTKGSKTASVKAGRDYDGDGKTESPAKEYRGSVHNAIQRKKGKVPDGKDTSNVKEEFIGEVNDEKTEKKIGDKKVNNKKYINLKPTLGGTMESVEVTQKPSTLKNFQTQQKPNPADTAKNNQIVKIQKNQISSKMAQLNKGVPLTQSYEPEGENVQEVAPPGMEGTVKAMKKHKEIDNPYALAWSMKNKGYKSHKKASGAMKEEASCGDEKTKISAEDPRSIKTKENLIKNKFRAMGLKMSYEPEGEMVDEGQGEFRSLGRADQNRGRNRYMGGGTADDMADDKKRGDAAAARAVAQLRRRRAAEEARKQGK